VNVLSEIYKNKIIAIIRGAKPEDVLSIAKALKKGGIRILEITMNSPGALSVIKRISGELGDEMVIGAGTVLDPETTKSALDHGAKFILSPVVDVETIKLTKKYGAVSIPGAFTPTEILNAFEAGGDIIKVFPASSIKPSYIKEIHGPLPQIPLLPTGGVNLDNIKDFNDSGAAGFGIGGSLVNSRETVTKEYLDNLTEKAVKFLKKIK
jgi:2-dehydro-3-deoxyphosphogluconate aldolase/(4S)-4-hydroxy-2-oxoglutarate aldolase